jgi:hypothetical protein
MKNVKHGNCRQHDNGFDSDLCYCGCAAVGEFLTPAEIAGFTGDEAETEARALSHARAVNARADFSLKEAA